MKKPKSQVLLHTLTVFLALAGVALITSGCAGLKGAVTGDTHKRVGELEELAARLQTGKADRTEVTEVSTKVTVIAAAQVETAGLLKETADALKGVADKVNAHGTAITGINVRLGKNDEWVAQTMAALDGLKTGKADKTMVDAGFKKLGGQVASAKKQLVDVKYITGAGHHEDVVWVDGFARCTYDSAKSEVGVGKLTDVQKKFLDEKVVKVYTDTPFGIKVVKGIASTEQFVDKGKPVEPAKNKELNITCARLRASMVAAYISAAIKVDVAYVGLGSTDDRGPHAANRSVGVVMYFADSDRVHGVAQAPAPPKPAAAPPAAPTPPAATPAPAPAAPPAPAPAKP